MLSAALMVLGSNQPLTEVRTRNLPVGKGQLVRKADNLTTICETSHTPMGSHSLLQGKLYHYVILKTVTVWYEDVQVYEMFMNMENSQACGCHLQEVIVCTHINITVGL
jgi:hypothetical protein